MHYLLFYDVVEDYADRRIPFRAAHLAHARGAAARGELLLGGALADPIDGAVLLFRGSSPAAALAFAAADPYVTNGLVTRWRVREWTTVVGPDAAVPTTEPAPVGGAAFRRATAADAEAIARLHVASWQAAYRGVLSDGFLDSQDVGERAATWVQRLARPETIVLLDEGPEGLTGFCASGPSHDPDADRAAVWEVYNLHVAPVRRGGGIGGRLFDAAVALGRDRRARLLTLWVVDRNAPARRFYERKGMTPDGARQAHVVGPGATLSEIRYRMRLASTSA